MLATAVVVFPLLNSSVKYLAADYSLVQIICVRSVVHLLWMHVVCVVVMIVLAKIVRVYQMEHLGQVIVVV